MHPAKYMQIAIGCHETHNLAGICASWLQKQEKRLKFATMRKIKTRSALRGKIEVSHFEIAGQAGNDGRSPSWPT